MQKSLIFENNCSSWANRMSTQRVNSLNVFSIANLSKSALIIHLCFQALVVFLSVQQAIALLAFIFLAPLFQIQKNVKNDETKFLIIGHNQFEPRDHSSIL